MLKRVIFIGIGVVVLIVVIFSVFKGSSGKSNQLTMVKVERGQIVDKALAIGTLVPKNEIAVKSKISGIVKKVFVEIGDKVKKGDLATIPVNKYHRVVNSGRGKLVFLTIFEKSRHGHLKKY